MNLDCSNIENFKNESQQESTPNAEAPVIPQLPIGKDNGNNNNNKKEKIDDKKCNPNMCEKYKENNFINTFILDIAPKRSFQLYGSYNALDSTEEDRRLLNSMTVAKFNYVCGDSSIFNRTELNELNFIPNNNKIDTGGIITSKNNNTYKIRINSPKKDNDTKDTFFTYFTLCKSSICNLNNENNTFRVCLTDDIINSLDFEIYLI